MRKQRIRDLEFNIQNKDYFINLATFLNLLREELCSQGEEFYADLLGKTIDDLRWLHVYAEIRKKRQKLDYRKISNSPVNPEKLR